MILIGPRSAFYQTPNEFRSCIRCRSLDFTQTRNCGVLRRDSRVFRGQAG
jgi:hypothetical protein